MENSPIHPICWPKQRKLVAEGKSSMPKYQGVVGSPSLHHQVPPFPPPFLSTFWTTRYNGSLLGMPRLRVVFTTLKSKDCYYRVRRESNSQLQSRGIIRGWTAIQEGEELVGFPWEIHLTLLPLYMYTRVELDRRPSVVSSPAHVLFFGSVRPCIPTVYGITDVSNC